MADVKLLELEFEYEFLFYLATKKPSVLWTSYQETNGLCLLYESVRIGD